MQQQNVTVVSTEPGPRSVAHASIAHRVEHQIEMAENLDLILNVISLLNIFSRSKTSDTNVAIFGNCNNFFKPKFTSRRFKKFQKKVASSGN